MSLDLAGIYDRVQRRLEAVGLSADKASKLAGKPDAIRNMKRALDEGKRTGVTTSTLTALAPVLQTSTGWLLDGTGTEAIPREIERVPLDREDRAEFVEDRDGATAAGRFERRQLQPGEVIERNVTAGLGHGGQVPAMVVDGQVVDDVRFVWRLPPDFIRAELRANENDVDFISVEGDSMVPTLLPGDRVLVNRRHNAPGDGLFVIHDGIGPAVKRLEVVKRSNPVRVRIKSDNPQHGTDEVLAEDLPVIGRVICKVTRL